MARLLLFGPAREAAGAASAELPGPTVAAVISGAERRFGEKLAAVVAVSNIWLNGVAAELDEQVTDDDEVAVVPPVSGG